MKRLAVLVFTLTLVFALVGCVGVTSGKGLLKEGTVKSVSVSSLPEGYSYSFSGEEAMAVVGYIQDLNLIAKFEENPNDYDGLTWVITFKYDNGKVLKLYHFGNMFIGTEDGKWYKMKTEEANCFGELLNELKSR